MLPPTTEQLLQTDAIDMLSPHAAAQVMLEGHMAALDAAKTALSGIAQAAEAMATAIRAENSIVYMAAGSSGLMALADASELPGTFGIAAASIQIHMAGGIPSGADMPGDTEDDTEAAKRDAMKIKSGDAVIVLSASGSTPYAVTAAGSAREKGGVVIAIANNPHTPLLALADIAICVPTPPEVIAGSTRLGAGTAQKAVLNMMSSLMGVHLGHVYQGQMVNVVADNDKLVKRAVGIIKNITGVSNATAEAALQDADGNAKRAILMASGCSMQSADELLAAHDGQLGRCLQFTTQTKTQSSNQGEDHEKT